MTERKFGDVQIKATPVYTDEDRERILGKGLSDDFKRYYANLGEELKPAAVVGLAQNSNADPEVLGLLFEESWKTEFSEIDRLRQALAMSFNTENDRDMDFAILRCLASNPATPEFALQRLAGDETFGVWVADNPGVSDDVLEIVVANDCLYEENLPVSLDPARSPEFLRRAVEYGCTDFLPNPSMPGEVLREFSKHEDVDVRCLVAKNPSLPLDVMEELAKEADSIVIDDLLGNPSMPQEMLLSLVDSIEIEQCLFAGNPSAPVEKLQEWAQEDRFYRINVAHNPKASSELLDQLAGDSSARVRNMVAESRNASAGAFCKLAGDEDYEVRMAVACNPVAPAEALESLVGDEDWRVLKALAENPSLPEACARKLAKSEDYEVREAVAKNPSCPWDLLLTFYDDPSDDVVAAFFSRL